MAQFVKTINGFPGDKAIEWVNLEHVVSIVDEGERYALYMRIEERDGITQTADHYVAKKDLKLP